MKQIQVSPHPKHQIGFQISKIKTLNLVIFITLSIVIYVAINPLKNKKPRDILSYNISDYNLACPYEKNIYLPVSTNQQFNHQNAKALLIPHHLLASNIITNSLNRLTKDYETIILVGPNHKDIGEKTIQTSTKHWKTEFGMLEPDINLITQLSNSISISTAEEYISMEHSICGIVSYIKEYFPDTKILPLMLKSNTNYAELDQLANTLTKNCKKCLLLVSVDFSHNVSPQKAEKNDTLSINILLNQNKNKINNIVADSITSLYLLLSYLETIETTEANLLANENSETVSNIKQETVTSYVSIIYK